MFRLFHFYRQPILCYLWTLISTAFLLFGRGNLVNGLFLSSLDVKFDDFSALWIWHSGKFCNGSIRFLSVRMGRVHMEYFDEDFLRVRMERVRMGYFNRDFFCEIF
ncbi:hypothetical protein RhiirA1_481190 [Rhizophagus irregularis]|uniref:Uncharacterized protein n=1 Tax=Rhizophagus irregularis TaxID=588596 RepID=A0A2N0QNF2_9GLOM|nr:hypothetical protein RhiirA1_481190 [Rhizophagus irregularis]